ncbi:MAG: diguanylate cyclase [Phycisphaerales bacterium]|nr:diguanylate cyclase [Phycisphaerales bacterium]
MTSDPTFPKLLVIDDSELIHRLLRVRLQGERIEIHGASNPRDGLKMAKHLKPDVILLDIDMDEMDGFEVIQHLKADIDTQGIAVIFISASGEQAHKIRGLDLGAVDFISKPFDVPELKARVRSAIRVQQLIRMLEEKAQIDGMTGLWNHKYFDRRIADEVAESVRHNKKLSLVMTDLDRFKGLNDFYGHPFGDKVIERFSNILTSGRTSDIACRYGGEEFAVILTNTNSDEAAEVAERYRVAFEASVWADHPDMVVTASFGVCDISRLTGAPTAETLIHAADAALYRAKQGGRNRVEVTPTPKAVAH